MDASPLRRALTALASRESLSDEQTAEVFGIVMSGEATPAQIGGLLMGLRAKGETADELAGAARALRNAMIRVSATQPHLVDTCVPAAAPFPRSTFRRLPLSSPRVRARSSPSTATARIRRGAVLPTCSRHSAFASCSTPRARAAC